MTTPKITRYTIVSHDHDTRAVEMVRDPKGDFSRARAQARIALKRDVARAERRNSPRLNSGRPPTAVRPSPRHPFQNGNVVGDLPWPRPSARGSTRPRPG